MVKERVHAFNSTGISLHHRFTVLASIATVARKRRWSSGFSTLGLNVNNQNLMNQIAQRLVLQNVKKAAIKQRIGRPGLRRFGSEGSLAGLRRSNSFGNLSQQSVKNRIGWRQFNSNLSRSASFNNLSQGEWRGQSFRRRGGRTGLVRGRMRVRAGRQQIVGRQQNQQRGTQQSPGQRTATRGPRGPGGMRGRGRGRAGIATLQKSIPTKEELDLQLDQYMASTKTALDRELDLYMESAMEME